MLELFFSACGAGACVVLMMLIAKDFSQSVAARAFFVLIFGAFVYLCHGWLPKSLWSFAYMIESATPAFFWISSRLIFQEGKPLPRLGLAIALHSFITPAAAILLGLDIENDPFWLVFVTRTIPQWFEYLLIIMGMVALLRGREDDLVESRRRLRWAIMGAAGLSLGWTIFSFNFQIGSAASRILAVDVSILIIIGFLVKGRSEIWGACDEEETDSIFGNNYPEVTRTNYFQEQELNENREVLEAGLSQQGPYGVVSESLSQTVPQTQGDQLASSDLLSLQELMKEGFYRRENLTLKDLAKEMCLPEYRVRAVINKELKYRNFNEFINEYRISEAAERLITEPETPISNIALDVGYRTLSSFNRAFRKEKETTPTAFREAD